jgi:hypothetical protein
VPRGRRECPRIGKFSLSLVRLRLELPADYYRLTGKPLGVTGEIAEFLAADALGLELVPPRTPGYDAIRRTQEGAQRIQIKGRAYGDDAKPGQRLGIIKRGAACD